MKLEKEYRYIGFDLHKVYNEAVKIAPAKLVKYKRAVFDIPGSDGWLRLRTDQNKTTLTVKINLKGEGNINHSMEEEVHVDDFDSTIKILDILGYKPRSIQNNYRILFNIKGTQFTIDIWPKISPVIEIEADEDAQIQEVEKIFGLSNFYTPKTITDLYKDIDIDVKFYKELDFDVVPDIINYHK